MLKRLGTSPKNAIGVPAVETHSPPGVGGGGGVGVGGGGV